MPSKTEEYLALSQRTANGLTRYWESWTDYLTTASRLYKYPFADQLMIYTQRPDATACADFDIWNNRMNRYVRRGAKGIALLDESSGFPRLHYVFDVSDTGVRRNSRDPEVWQLGPDLVQPVSEMLSKTYGISGERVSQQLADIAGKLVADYWDNNGGDIRAIVDGSLLMDYDEAGVEMLFKSAAAISVTYTLLERCGFEPAGWFDKDDFRAIHEFSTPNSVYALGAAVSDMSREVLRNIERTVKTTIRRRNNERSQHEYEQQSELHADRGLSSPEPAFGGEYAQNHLRAVCEILVDGKAILGLAKLHPCRFDVRRAITLLQKDNIADNIRASVGTESVVGQTNGPQQIGSFCHVLAGRRIFTVQRVTAGNKRHHAARTYLVDSFGEKVVVDRKSQLVICLIVDLILTERHIAHRQIVEITAVGGLKTSHGNVCLRVQHFCNAPGDAVQLHAVQPTALHGVRQHSKEVAHTHRRFQDVSRLEAHLLDRIVDTTDHGGAGVVGVQSRSASSGVFVLGEQSFQFGVFLCPAIFTRVKGICQTAPAHILRKHLLLLGGGTPVLLFQLEQGSDSFNVPGVLLFCTALAQMIVRDVEVPGKFKCGSFRFNCIQSR